MGKAVFLSLLEVLEEKGRVWLKSFETILVIDITLLHTVDIKTEIFIFLDYVLLVAYLHVQYFISGHRTNLGCLPLMFSKLASQISQITKGMCQFCWTEREGWLWANCLYSGRTTGLAIISSLSSTELTCCINELADPANLVWQIFSAPRFYL